MRYLTNEEIEINKKLGDKNLSKEEREKLKAKLIAIDKEQTKNYPFCH